jgi:acetyl-CoA synthetase
MGVSAPGCDLDVVDDAGRRLADGEEGNIALKAPNPQLMLGYRNAPERTAECYVNGPDGTFFLTGDRGVRDGDGYLWYRGRADDVINSAGYRIGPLEVENAILEHGDVAECAVVGAPDPERGEVVKAFIVLRPGVEGSDGLVRAVQDHVKRVTAPYKYPRAVEFRNALPKTMTGKIMRRALREEAKEAAGLG